MVRGPPVAALAVEQHAALERRERIGVLDIGQPFPLLGPDQVEGPKGESLLPLLPRGARELGERLVAEKVLELEVETPLGR